MTEYEHKPVTVIEPHTAGQAVDWRELWEYRDLFFLLVWRNLKARYAQSVIGVGWAVLQPLATMLVYTVIFGMLVGVESNGVPYPLFSFAALAPWTYFSNSLSGATGSLVGHAGMIRKIYFPKLLLPMAIIGARLVDFVIALLILAVLMAGYGLRPTPGILMIPALVGILIIAASGLGLWLTALAIQYRDVTYSSNLIVQVLMYATPVIYPASLVPPAYRYFYSLNPMVGVVEGFRSALLGTGEMPWDSIAIGAVSALVLFFTGIRYFQKREHVFADVA